LRTGLDIDRCFTVAAYSAFVVLRQFLAKNPNTTAKEAVSIIEATNADNTGLDYLGGQEIYLHLNDILDISPGTNNLRSVIGELIRSSRPWWIRLIPYGREKVRSSLHMNQVQCLREAGLLDAVPDAGAIAWWDEMAALMRGVVDGERMTRARQAERLSLEYERARLKDLGIHLEPVWVSLDDNTLGYDIRSYNKEPSGIVSRLIEVKSTTNDSIYITRNEWRNAVSANQRYLFHVWLMPAQKMVEYPASAMEPSIPVDKGTGEWQNVRITLS